MNGEMDAESERLRRVKREWLERFGIEDDPEAPRLYLEGSRPVKWCKSAPTSQLGQRDAVPSSTTSFGSTK
jgi:hypothetical protein